MVIGTNFGTGFLSSKLRLQRDPLLGLILSLVVVGERLSVLGTYF